MDGWMDTTNHIIHYSLSLMGIEVQKHLEGLSLPLLLYRAGVRVWSEWRQAEE